MTDTKPVQSISVFAHPGDKAVLSIVAVDRGAQLFTIERDQLRQLNTEIVDALLDRVPK
jgi:hypothetical protein